MGISILTLYYYLQIIWMSPRRILLSNEDVIVVNDNRVGIEQTKQGDWNLRIKHAQHNDSGEYLCQINTSPVKIKRVRLKVLGKCPEQKCHFLMAKAESQIDMCLVSYNSSLS
jgi:hypothetical protein